MITNIKAFENAPIMLTLDTKNKIDTIKGYKSFVYTCLDCFLLGAWGDIPEDEREQNNNELTAKNGRVFAVYKQLNHKIFICADALNTPNAYITVLQPSDY